MACSRARHSSPRKRTARKSDGEAARRQRAASSVGEALWKGREPGEEGNGSRTTKGRSPCEELTRSSQERANRWRPTKLLAAASMAAGRRGLDSGRENAGASSRRLEEVKGLWARGIEKRRPELVGAAMGASSARAPGGGRWGGEGEHGSGEGLGRRRRLQIRTCARGTRIADVCFKDGRRRSRHAARHDERAPALCALSVRVVTTLPP